VSNVVLAVEADGRRLVVKQSLERLRVAAEWTAPQRRILAEAAGLRVAAGIDADSVPTVVDVDPENMLLVLEMAPDGARDWKQDLMRGEVDTQFAARVGHITGVLHASTWDAQLPPELADDPDAFEALRLAPYHEATAAAIPELAGAIRDVADRIRATRRCLVHGDLSPKNILRLPDATPHAWLIDFEVAHRGDPTFDVAFMLTHLMMKSVYRPADAARYDEAADEFLAAYGEHRSLPDEIDLSQQMGCLLLARVVGKSPAEYLSEHSRERVRALGELALLTPSSNLSELREWRNLRWQH
jgi:tRNA A-37 threonylcarbamoyl transferase component Bud32